MKKNQIIIVIIIVVLALIVIWRLQTSAPAPVQPPVTQETPVTVEELLEEDTTSAALEVLDSLDLGDLDAEFEAIDADLNQL